MSETINVFAAAVADPALKLIAQKVSNHERITDEECILLFEKGSLGFVGSLANYVREKMHGNKTYFFFKPKLC